MNNRYALLLPGAAISRRLGRRHRKAAGDLRGANRIRRERAGAKRPR